MIAEDLERGLPGRLQKTLETLTRDLLPAPVDKLHEVLISYNSRKAEAMG